MWFEKVVASGTNQNLIDGQATDAVGGKWATYDETHQTTTPTTFKIPALIPDFNEFAIIKLTVGPGTITTKKLAIKKYIISIECIFD